MQIGKGRNLSTFLAGSESCGVVSCIILIKRLTEPEEVKKQIKANTIQTKCCIERAKTEKLEQDGWQRGFLSSHVVVIRHRREDFFIGFSYRLL